MKLLIIGCGSIGSRHARNARSLGYEVVLVDPDPTRGQYLTYEEALQKEPVDAAVVASPSNLHIAAAEYLVERSVPILMEKPLATSRDGLTTLVQSVEEKKLITMMAQSFRWHEGMLEVKRILEAETFGKPISVEYRAGQYLPDWHPDRDYRTEYAAQKKMGGGAMFVSMSHSLDTVEWFFGEIKEYAGTKKRIGDLEIDVDDTTEITCSTARGVQVVASSDFLARPSFHTMHIVCEEGVIAADFAKNEINGTPYAFDPNKRYVDELAYFISLLDRGEPDPALTLAHGAHIVDLMTDPRIIDLTL